MASLIYAPDKDLLREHAKKGGTITRIEDRDDGWFLVFFAYPPTLPDNCVLVIDCLDEMEAAAFVLAEMEKCRG